MLSILENNYRIRRDPRLVWPESGILRVTQKSFVLNTWGTTSNLLAPDLLNDSDSGLPTRAGTEHGGWYGGWGPGVGEGDWRNLHRGIVGVVGPKGKVDTHTGRGTHLHPPSFVGFVYLEEPQHVTSRFSRLVSTGISNKKMKENGRPTRTRSRKWEDQRPKGK